MDAERRARRLAAKRRAVKNVAVQLALEQGLESLTVEAISEAADISQRTFFNYFATREDALVMEVSWAPEELRALFEDRPEEEPVLTSLRETFRSVAADLDSQRAEAEAFHELYRRHPQLLARQRPEQAQQLVSALVEAVAARTGADPTSDFGPTITVNAALAVLQATVRFHWSTATAHDLEALLDEGFDALARGL